MTLKLLYDNRAQRGDLRRDAVGNLDTDEGLETAVSVSLFTDARANDDDGAAAGADRRGWWGSQYLAAANHKLGSRLWLLKRMSAAQALRRAPALAEEALAWLVTDKVASSVTATASRLSGRDNVLLLAIEITRPQRTAPRWRRTWEVQLAV